MVLPPRVRTRCRAIPRAPQDSPCKVQHTRQPPRWNRRESRSLASLPWLSLERQPWAYCGSPASPS